MRGLWYCGGTTYSRYSKYLMPMRGAKLPVGWFLWRDRAMAAVSSNFRAHQHGIDRRVRTRSKILDPVPFAICSFFV